MKKKHIIFIFIFIVILFLIDYIGIDKYDSYTGARGTKETGNLVNGLQAAYDKNIFIRLSTNACNDEYGSFVFKGDGKFYYFSEEKNIFNDSHDNVSQYMGYWYYDNKHIMKFTVFRTYLNRKFLNLIFKEKEYILPFDYVNSKEYSYSDDLLIDNKLFKLLNDELTEKSKEKLRLDENIINQYLFSN